MSSWIDLHALWRIVLVGVIAGAGLPAVFAIGLRALAIGTTEGQGEAKLGSNPVGVAAAGVCFAVVLAGIAWGVYMIVDGT